MTTTSIDITFVDNELYIIAIPASATASAELFHYVSGYNATMNVKIVPQTVLPPGLWGWEPLTRLRCWFSPEASLIWLMIRT